MTVGAQAWLILALGSAVAAAWGWVSMPRVPTRASLRSCRMRTWARWARGHQASMSPLRRSLLVGPALLGAAALLQGLGIPAVVAWPLAAVMASAGWVVIGRLEPDAVRRRREQLIDDLPHTCELLGSCLRAGLPMRAAVAAVGRAVDGPAAEDLAAVEALIAIGSDEASAWRSLSQHPQWGSLAVDLARSCEYGSPLGAVLQEHATRARTQRRATREVRARTAGVKSVLPLMVCFLPAFFAIGVVPIIAGLVLRMLP